MTTADQPPSGAARAGLRPQESKLAVGDLHVHTSYSDGIADLTRMVLEAHELGRTYLAVTDHSPRLTVANGLTARRLQAQWEEISLVQQEIDLPILRGIEVDILRDGALDQTDELLDQLSVVVASVHSRFSDPAEFMTRRMIRAIANPHTTILGHCTARKQRPDGSWRPPIQFDAELVFAACAQFGVAVEINARPDRADPPLDLLILANELGCLFAVSSDAHRPVELASLPLGYQRAKEAGIDLARIITTWDLDQLLAHCRRHR